MFNSKLVRLLPFLTIWLLALTGPALAQTPGTGTVRGHIQAASGESLLELAWAWKVPP